MGYPYDGISEYSDDEIQQMYNNGEISADEGRNLARNSGGSWDTDDDD